MSRLDVPKEFWSDLNEEPFSHCTLCDKELREGVTRYMVEKAVRIINGFPTTIFEYAICQDCAKKRSAELSEDSMERIRQYFDTNVLESHRKSPFQTTLDERDELMRTCCITGKHVDELDEYQMIATCRGKHLDFTGRPFMISGEAAEQISELLSVQTKDELDDFMGDIYTGPPELEELFKGTPVLI